MTGPIYRKQYRHDLLWQKHREIMFLSMLAGHCNFPELLGFDQSSIFITHCGRHIDKDLIESEPGFLNRIDQQMHHILTTLEVAHIRHRDITQHNVLWDEGTGRLMLIDFGWSIWDWEKYSPVPLPEPMWGMRKSDIAQWEALRATWA